MLARRSVQNYEHSSFFGVFSRLCHFPQVFGQVKEWLILELHEMIKVPDPVACPMDFNLLCYRGGQQRGALKLMKNDHFLIFSAIQDIFPTCLGM